MKRLYLQIYVAVLGVILLFALLSTSAFWLFKDGPRSHGWLDEIQAFAEASIPPIEAPPEYLEKIARNISESFEVDLTIYDSNGAALVRIGDRLPAPPTSGGSQMLRHRAGHRTLALALADGRWVIADSEKRERPIPHLFLALAALTLATGIGAYPLTRRLTRRLEVVKTHVEALGEGRLDQRVPVEGHDEIAQLATAFNRTAERIENLVADKARLLANTSHELRTPLARVRMAVALLDDGPRPDLLERIDRDIEELDGLIGELLVASRLDAPEQPFVFERVDLLALAAEEAARIEGVEVRGTRAIVDGDPRLLRRLVRNLLENAVRYGEVPIEIEFPAAQDLDRICMVVADRGPGIAESERERIFTSFYRPSDQPSAEGSVGLGLALVRQIAERHKGHILCEAREGGGTRFVLDLPVASC